jgi:hypothetical protein
MIYNFIMTIKFISKPTTHYLFHKQTKGQFTYPNFKVKIKTF